MLNIEMKDKKIVSVKSELDLEHRLRKFSTNNQEALIKEMEKGKSSVLIKLWTMVGCNPVFYLLPLYYIWKAWLNMGMDIIYQTESNPGTILLHVLYLFIIGGLSVFNIGLVGGMVKNPSRFFKKIYYRFLSGKSLSFETYKMLKEIMSESELIELVKNNNGKKLTYNDIYTDENTVYCHFYNKKVKVKKERRKAKEKAKAELVEQKKQMKELKKKQDKTETNEKMEDFIHSLYKED